MFIIVDQFDRPLGLPAYAHRTEALEAAEALEDAYREPLSVQEERA